MSLKTPLFTQHVQSGAKMVDFAGWQMPLHYGSQLNEHRQVREDAGIFDVSHMTIHDIVGPQATDALCTLLANDVAKLTTPGQALYSCLLDHDAKIIDDVIVYKREPQSYRIVSNSATKQTVCRKCGHKSKVSKVSKVSKNHSHAQKA